MPRTFSLQNDATSAWSKFTLPSEGQKSVAGVPVSFAKPPTRLYNVVLVLDTAIVDQNLATYLLEVYDIFLTSCDYNVVLAITWIVISVKQRLSNY